MVPSHELRLRSMIRAMQEVLIPAIDPSSQLAVDQAHILVGNLRILLAQHDKTYQFAMTELREYASLVEGLLMLVDGSAAEHARVALDAAAAIVALDLPAQAALIERVEALKRTADLLTEAALHGGDTAGAAARRLVLEQSRAQVLRERVWMAESGFEADAAALPTVEDVLA